MPLTVGGGVRSVEDARALLLAGADKVAVNSAAVTRPELVREIAEKFGSQCVVASVDARASTSGDVRGWEIYTHGGRKPTGIDAVEHAIRLAELGAGELLVTSMDGDGTKNGYDVEADPRDRRCGQRAGDRQRRGGHARPSRRRRNPRPCQRSAGCIDLSFWRSHGGRSACRPARSGATRTRLSRLGSPLTSHRSPPVK